jgi:GAF domain-containing protein
MVESESLEETLRTIASITNDSVASCEGVGITLQTAGRPQTVASDGGFAESLDNAQYDDDDGPCLRALRENHVVVVQRIAETLVSWPSFARLAADLGVHSSMSMPLAVDEEPVGALNLYARAVGAFTPEVQRFASLFGTQAAVAVTNASVYWRTYELTEHLEKALENRDVIGQAKGILMASLGVTADQAFEILRDASQRENIKLRDVAQRVATTGEPPSSAPRSV